MQLQSRPRASVRLTGALTRRLSLPDRWTALAVLLFAGYLALIAGTFLDYGVTYDEDWQATYGEHVIRWYASGFRDSGALTYRNLAYYGGFFDVLLRLVARVSPLGLFETSHLLSALFGLLAVVAAYRLAKLLAGPSAGLLAALFVVVTPRFYGHAFHNPIDIPLAALSALATYYLVRLIPDLPRPPRSLVLKLGVSVGLALGVRAGAAVLIGYLAVTLSAWLVGKRMLERASGQGRDDWRRALLGLAAAFLAVCLIAYVVMLVWWPAAQVQPIKQPVRALLYSTRFEYTFDVLFEGRLTSTGDLPWYYVLEWLSITLPEFYFLTLPVGLVLAGAWVARSRKGLSSRERDHALAVAIVAVSAVFPVAYATIARPVNYDEVRHFLFVVPPMAVLAAVSLASAVRRFPSSLVTWIGLAAVSASALVTVADMAQLHPYEYIFFNRVFGGGVAQASRSFETDYWGSSYREGVQWLVENYRGRDDGTRPRVASCLYSLSTSYYLPSDRFEFVGSYDDGWRISPGTKPDVLLATTRWGCDKRLPGTVLHTVARQGAPLLFVIEVSQVRDEGGGIRQPGR